MRVLVCPTAFKGTLSAAGAASALAEGVRRAISDGPLALRAQPLSDGGPGLLDALTAGQRASTADSATPAEAPASGKGARLTRYRVPGPLGDPVEGRVLHLAQGEAVLESADACGLERLAGRFAPLRADTAGVGALVRRALEAGSRRVRVGLGGSGSTDGGTGLGRAFGYRFLDARDRPLPPGGGALADLARIRPGRRPAAEVLALADVDAPLTGTEGAARVFGPQKGAEPEEVERLAAGLERLAERLRADLGVEVAALPGAGAAGGLGAGCVAFLGARLVSGADWLLDRIGFQDALRGTDLLVTGEGAWDSTSRGGKVVGRVLEHARRAEVPVVLVCGRVEGPPPEAEVVRSGEEGRELSASDLARLAQEGVRRFLSAGGRRWA